MINTICDIIVSMKDNKLLNTLKFSFIKSIPVLIGYVFMGIAFGILLYVAGFDFRYALLMAMFIYSGTLQFAAVSFLSQGTDILSVILISATMNFRYLFYGISSLERYRNTSFYKPFLIHYTVDETFSIISSTPIDDSIDRVRFYFFLSLFDHIYWVIGCVLGNVLASFISFDSTGIDFIMTALFIVLFMDQMSANKNNARIGGMGIIVSLVCLLLIGKKYFIVFSLLIITAILLIGRRKK